MRHTCITDDGGTPNRKCEACANEKPVRVDYVVGFAFNESLTKVLVIRKNRPAWQAGKLNGVGGHVEEQEPPEVAMAREFFEETNLSTLACQWRHFATVLTPKSRVWMFMARLEDGVFNRAQTPTDEVISAVSVAKMNWDECLPNLRWLVPMATMAWDLDAPVEVREQSELGTATLVPLAKAIA